VVTPLAQVAIELEAIPFWPTPVARHVFRGTVLKKEGGVVTGQAELAGEVGWPLKNSTAAFPAATVVGGVKVPVRGKGEKGGGGAVAGGLRELQRNLSSYRY